MYVLIIVHCGAQQSTSHIIQIPEVAVSPLRRALQDRNASWANGHQVEMIVLGKWGQQ